MRVLPKRAEGYLMGRIGSDGWADCSGCGPVREPVFPVTHQDPDGPATLYYCRHCFRHVKGHPLKDENTYGRQYMNLQVSKGSSASSPTVVDWLIERRARRKLVREIWSKEEECPTCHGSGRVREKEG